MKKIFMHIDCLTYWWNMGTMKLEHRGNVYDYFQSKSIKVRKILSPSKEMEGFRFKMNVSSASITLDIFETPERAAAEAIKTFLNILGDKATLQLGYRNYKINWR